jgi:adenylate kinase family enzyme
MKRVLVIGPGGAGKSTFARQLGEILGLEVIHLDARYWKPGWVQPAKPEWAATVEAALGRDAWVMDGNYSGTLERRLAACDTVVFLDLPRRVCLWRVLRRAARYRNRTRPDMAPGCPERFDLAFLLWIWSYPARTRPKVLRLLREGGEERKVVRLDSPKQVDRYLAQVQGALVAART